MVQHKQLEARLEISNILQRSAFVGGTLVLLIPIGSDTVIALRDHSVSHVKGDYKTGIRISEDETYII